MEVIPEATPGAPEATSTQHLMAVTNETDKETYYKSFETDSFDLDDCFDGDTQPENSSLLKNRLRERKDTTNQTVRMPAPKAAAGTSRTGLTEDQGLAARATIAASTPLKYPPIFQFDLAGNEQPNTETTDKSLDPIDSAAKKNVIAALRELKKILAAEDPE